MSNDSLVRADVYRDLAKSEPDTRQECGLIRLKLEEPHKCKLPGFWYRLFHRVAYGNLWRCSCKLIYQWLPPNRHNARDYSENSCSYERWCPVGSIAPWVDNGGKE